MVKYEFQYDYMKAKYGEKVKLCFMDTGSFIAYIKTEDIFSDIVQDAETRFDTTNFELDRPLSEGKNKLVIGLMKDELDQENRICCIRNKNTQLFNRPQR